MKTFLGGFFCGFVLLIALNLLVIIPLAQQSGYGNAKKEAIKAGVAYYHPTEGNIVWGIHDSSSSIVVDEHLPQAKGDRYDNGKGSVARSNKAGR